MHYCSNGVEQAQGKMFNPWLLHYEHEDLLCSCLLIALSFVSLNFNPFEIALQLRSTTKITRYRTESETGEWCQEWSL